MLSMLMLSWEKQVASVGWASVPRFAVQLCPLEITRMVVVKDELPLVCLGRNPPGVGARLDGKPAATKRQINILFATVALGAISELGGTECHVL